MIDYYNQGWLMNHQTETNNRLKVLLVENSRTAMAVLTKQLLEHDYNVSGVTNGVSAIEEIKNNDYDLVIMDIFMPQMNGYEAVKHIRQINNEDKANITVIALTSSQSDRDKRTCFEAGMNEFVIKSTDQTELLEILKKYQPS
jgi:CheY-like chemotaxis protein